VKSIQTILICSALAATLGACGQIASTVNAAKKASGSSDSDNAIKLTDAAAQESTDAATATAAENDAAGDDAAPSTEPAPPEPGKPGAPELPAFIKAVQDARDYTRKLLGIDDSALKKFKAEVQAARALSSSPEEFKSNIAAAEDEFNSAMEAQKAKADAAREANKELLGQIYDGTVQVFLACGADVKLGEHEERGPRDIRAHDKGRKGPPRGHGGPGKQGPEQDGDEQGPRMMFGSGEFQGDFGSFQHHVQGGKMGLADAADATECTAATTALEALLTPQS
jgi:hypothetical protein